MTDEMIEQSLISFIKFTTGVDADMDSLIFDDLGIGGLDAASFMDQFSREFKVDLSNFDLNRYSFTEYEIGNIFLTAYRVIFHRKKLKKKSFRVAHLIEIIKVGKWVEPDK